MRWRRFSHAYLAHANIYAHGGALTLDVDAVALDSVPHDEPLWGTVPARRQANVMCARIF